MESNNELIEINIQNHTCYYFDDIISINELDFHDILLDEKAHQSVLIYDIAYKTLYGAKAFCIIFDKVDGYIRKYKTKFVGLF